MKIYCFTANDDAIMFFLSPSLIHNVCCRSFHFLILFYDVFLFLIELDCILICLMFTPFVRFSLSQLYELNAIARRPRAYICKASVSADAKYMENMFIDDKSFSYDYTKSTYGHHFGLFFPKNLHIRGRFFEIVMNFF